MERKNGPEYDGSGVKKVEEPFKETTDEYEKDTIEVIEEFHKKGNYWGIWVGRETLQGNYWKFLDGLKRYSKSLKKLLRRLRIFLETLNRLSF